MELLKNVFFFNFIYCKIKSTRIFEVLKHSSKYFIAQLFTTGLAFISLPIFTSLMSPEDYGTYSVFMAYSSFFLIIITLNLYTPVSRYFFEEKNDFEEFLGTLFSIISILLFASLLLITLLSNILYNSLNLPRPLIEYLFIFSIFLLLNTIYNQILIARKQSTEIVILSVSTSVMVITFGVIFVSSLQTDTYLGRIWALLLINFLFSIYYIVKFSKMIKINIKKEHVKYIFYFSIPLIPYALSSLILSFFDRIFLNNVKGASDTGIYSIGYTIASLVSIGISALNSAQVPEFFELMNSEKYEKYNLLSRRLYSLLVFFSVNLIFYSKEIVIFLTDPRYHESYIVVAPVVIGYLFFGLYFMYGQYIGYVKKNHYLSLVLLISGIVNMLFNLLLIPQYGYIAAAYVTLLSYLVLFLLTYFVVKFILKMRIVPIITLIGPLLVISPFILVFYEIESLNLDLFVNIILKGILILVLGFLLFFRDFWYLIRTKL